MDEGSNTVLTFFGLREQPFAATADPAFFCATREYKECLFRLWNTIDDRHGIAVILGHYGTGKTTLLRKLLTGMRAKPDRYNTAVIASPIPSWTSFSLLEALVSQFGLQPPKRSFITYMESLYRYLLAQRSRINTLIIDDAQNLNKRGQLELLRLVQNLETPQHKLLNLAFFAQLEWMPVLRAAPNFEQRISMAYTLGPLSEEETRRLIEYRLRQAGAGSRGPLFEDGALRVIHAFAEGSPRVTVTLCRNALLLAAQLKSQRITQAVILHTIQKTTLPDAQKNARIAAVLKNGVDETVPALTPPPEQPFPLHTAVGDAREERANRLLRNAAKRQAHGME
ncbi:MAG: AAA family ATPase [Candidatus Hydrogenedentes bacterium]|nr:AAA family ATPase [Candidatus Hydrogenedentota bacterium]